MSRMSHMSRTLRLLATAAALHAQTPSPVGGAGGSTGSGAMGAMGGQDSAGAMARRGGMRRSGPVDSTLVSQLDSVNTAAQAGLTTLPPSAAAALVGSIRSKLSGSRNPAQRTKLPRMG